MVIIFYGEEGSADNVAKEATIISPETFVLHDLTYTRTGEADGLLK